MKKLEVLADKNQLEKVETALKTLELSFTISQVIITDLKCVIFSTLVPDQLIDKAIEEISKNLDLRLKQNTISVFNVEAHVSPYLDKLEEKMIDKSPPSNPFERLLESTEKYTRFNKNLLLMAFFATIIALAGLFLDNAVTVIGAMLISPLLGPINAFALNTSIGKIKKLIRTELSIFMLIFSVIALSTIVTFSVSIFFKLPLTSQIALRGQTTLIDVVIGLVLGLAGGLALVTVVPEILVGVGVASALLPPASVSGIGLALFDGGLFWGALTLTIVYLIGLQLGCTLMLRAKGVRPRRFYEKVEARKHSAYFILILSFLLILLIWVIYATGGYV